MCLIWDKIEQRKYKFTKPLELPTPAWLTGEDGLVRSQITLQIQSEIRLILDYRAPLRENIRREPIRNTRSSTEDQNVLATGILPKTNKKNIEKHPYTRKDLDYRNVKKKGSKDEKRQEVKETKGAFLDEADDLVKMIR